MRVFLQTWHKHSLGLKDELRSKTDGGRGLKREPKGWRRKRRRRVWEERKINEDGRGREEGGEGIEESRGGCSISSEARRRGAALTHRGTGVGKKKQRVVLFASSCRLSDVCC